MWLFDFLKTSNSGNSGEKPAIKGVNIWGFWVKFKITYDFKSDVFFEFYERNPYIQAVINRIKKDIAGNGYALIVKDKEQDITEFEKLITKGTVKSFLERIVRDFEISGNSYVYLARDESENITAIQVLDPRYITPVSDKTGEIIGYIQNLYGVRAFAPDEIFHLYDDTDLENEIVWRSKMTSLYLDLMSDREASESNYSFFKNNQVPSTLIVMDQDVREDATDINGMKRIKELFTSENFWGGKNSNRTAFAKWVSQILQVQQRMDDAQFMNLRKFTLDMVCAVYEVPKDILWLTETSNRSVSSEQADTYYSNIVVKENLLQEFLSKIVAVCLGEEYSFAIFHDNFRILERKSKIAKELYKEAQLITLNEAREIIQYEEIKNGDCVYKENNFAKAKEEVA